MFASGRNVPSLNPLMMPAFTRALTAFSQSLPERSENVVVCRADADAPVALSAANVIGTDMQSTIAAVSIMETIFFIYSKLLS